MAYDNLIEGGLDYFPCRYGTSKSLFRGPRKSLDTPYVAMLGGTATYGRFVARPFCDLVEKALGAPVVNFGGVNAGLDLYVGDPDLMQMAGAARAVVIQIMDPPNMSNRLYTVHQRRNDRFLSATALLQKIYSGVDFTDINFTRHLLSVLREASPQGFERIEQELRSAWVARMRMLIVRLGRPVCLLWVSERSPDAVPEEVATIDPLFVDRAMLDALSDITADLVEVAAGDRGTAGMVFAEVEAPAAARTPGPAVHAEIAEAVTQSLKGIL